jgi:hypothetical protein
MPGSSFVLEIGVQMLPRVRGSVSGDSKLSSRPA